MTGQRELVLLLAADAPLARGDGGVLTHRHAGARLGVSGGFRDELGGPQFAQQRESLWHALGPVDLKQDATEVLVDGDRRVAGGVDAGGDAILDLAERDLVRDVDGGFEPGAAGLLDVIRRRPRREACAQHRLPGEVEVTTVLEHRAGRDLAEPGVLQAKPSDEAVQRCRQHVLVGGPGVRPVGAGERNAVAAQDGGAAEVIHWQVVGDMGGALTAFETIALVDLSLLVKVGVQYGLFGGVIRRLGTERHHQRYLRAAMTMELPGCFAMTETGHGSDVQSIRTTATYDASREAFVIHTPDDDARKDYIGNAARDGRMAAVFAQLITGGD